MNCKERTIECHSVCKKYSEFKAECRYENEERKKAVVDQSLKFRANKY
jgi:hypothetical protein